MSAIVSLESGQRKCRRKCDTEEVKLLVGEANDLFDELQQQNPRIIKECLMERLLI